jgi:hypothetical protein
MTQVTVNELTSARYAGVLKDETGALTGASAITSIALTLSDLKTGAIINGRNAQAALNANGVTLDDSGNLVWLMAPADNVIVATKRVSVEEHRAVFDIRWSTGKRLLHEFAILVTNVTQLSA